MKGSTKSSLRAFRREGGQGALRLRVETWIADMKVEVYAMLVDSQRKEDTFQVGWMMVLQDRLGHSVIRFGIVTPHDSALEDRWRRQEKLAAPSLPIMMKSL